MPFDTDPNNTGVAVSPNAAVLDTLYALGRQLTLILTAIPLLLTFLSTRDLIGFIAYIHTADGISLGGALAGLLAIGFGLVKTFKRGRLAAKAAASRRVPDDIAKLK